jgi:hypothetical protein
MNARLLRPLASGFNPKSIAGLRMWLDASDTSTISTSTGASQWRDKSGNGSAFIQNSGNNQPATGTQTMNGRNVLRFDGSDDFMEATDPWLTGTGGGLPASFFIVQRIMAATNFGMSYTVQSGASAFLEFRQSGTSGQMELSVNSGISVHVFSGSSVGVDELVSIIAPSGATNNLIYQRGTQQTLSGTANAKPPTTTALHSLGRRGSGTLFANVRIAEILAYQSLLTDAQRKAVEKYLGKKWGITVA